jgi:hypothetical protein
MANDGARPVATLDVTGKQKVAGLVPRPKRYANGGPRGLVLASTVLAGNRHATSGAQATSANTRTSILGAERARLSTQGAPARQKMQ